uniref:TIGR02587 family membrane protein n=1 Tax=Trichocoleus desertorum TaxID=1481672 RepID=UPI0025B4DEC5|nr:TIGR02587 family membrane protein [Trichocoleus desertorum]
MSPRKRRKGNIWLHELDDLIRGASGGFLFGIPLLYTMEVWWIGSSTEPPLILLACAATFVVIFLLNRTAGFRKSQGAHPIDAARETIEAIAIGFVCAALVLVLLREVTWETSRSETLGKVAFEGIPFALGVALANQFLSSGRNGDDDAQATSFRRADDLNETLSDIGATLIGSLIIAFNIAPTDEVAMLAAAISGPWLLLMIVASLLITYGIVFEAGFANEQRRYQQPGIFQRPLSETVAAYLVSLIAAAAMLFFFQRLDFQDPWSMWLSYTLVLGLPASVGGAAGRLAI